MTGRSPAAAPEPPAQPDTGRRGVWDSREFRGLTAAYLATLCGDQLARVALLLLVFARTGSALAAAGAFAVTLLPALVGGPLLSGLADRHPRRAVMVRCDLAAAALTALMAVPAVPMPALFALVFAVTLLNSPFAAARSSLVREIFGDDRYAAATTVSTMMFRASQILGYAAGGLLVAGLGARTALAVDAGTFLVSAAVVRTTVADRPAAADHHEHAGYLAELAAGVRLVFGDRSLRRLTLYAWLAAFHVIPFAVVAPYVAAHHGGPVAVGLLLAASAAGTGLAMILLNRRAPERRVRLIAPLAVLAGVPLIACAVNPGLLVTALLWAISGAGISYQVAANIAFVSAVPNHRRGQAFGLVATGLLAGQGIAILVAGALATTLSPAAIIAGAGITGTVAAAALAVSPSATRRQRPSGAAISSLIGSSASRHADSADRVPAAQPRGSIAPAGSDLRRPVDPR